MSCDVMRIGRRGRLAAGRGMSGRRRRLQPEFLLVEERVLLSTLNVTNLNDSGTGSLRYELGQAHSGDTIDFTSGAASGTITLTSGVLPIATNLTITGPGAANLTVNGGGNSGVFTTNQGVTASISGLKITGGATNIGGGIDNNGSLTLTSCTISGNSAKYGGGLFDQGTLTLSGCTVSGNSAQYYGGGVDDHGTLSITGSTISGNSAIEGGGVLAENLATITGSTISGNFAQYGGGVFTDATTTITGSTISGNTGSENGGGVDNTSHLTVNSSTISGNSAHWGGGLYEAAGGAGTLVDCTISGNTGAFGGGLNNAGTSTLTNCTIADNTATGTTPTASGGGIYDYFGTLGLTNTIVASNTAPAGVSDIRGNDASSVTGSYNLIGTGGSGGITNGSNHNIVLTSLTGLGLSSLGSYGGLTQTIALLPGSPALGAGTTADIPGTNTPITTDQRGKPLDSPNPDIGAFQSQGFTLTVVSGDSPQSTTVGTAFARPLAVTVAAKNPVEPVIGGVVKFAAPSSGASATLSAATATIGSNGVASVTATANSTAGSYSVTASIPGTTASTAFALTNTAASSATASFIKTDAATSGNWVGTYGSQGYDIDGYTASLPGYATVSFSSSATPHTWSTGTTDTRTPQAPGASTSAPRVAGCWFSASSFTVDVSLSDGQAHDLELYFLDWDNQGRSEQVQITSASTGAVLSTQSIASFGSGVYLDYAVSGSIVITISTTGAHNAVLSGLFLDPASNNMAPLGGKSPGGSDNLAAPSTSQPTESSTMGVGFAPVASSIATMASAPRTAMAAATSGPTAGPALATGPLPDGRVMLAASRRPAWQAGLGSRGPGIGFPGAIG